MLAEAPVGFVGAQQSDESAYDSHSADVDECARPRFGAGRPAGPDSGPDGIRPGEVPPGGVQWTNCRLMIAAGIKLAGPHIGRPSAAGVHSSGLQSGRRGEKITVRVGGERTPLGDNNNDDGGGGGGGANNNNMAPDQTRTRGTCGASSKSVDSARSAPIESRRDACAETLGLVPDTMISLAGAGSVAFCFCKNLFAASLAVRRHPADSRAGSGRVGSE